jgi:hypothetical protein
MSFATSVSCGLCTYKTLNVSHCGLSAPYASNQLAEARAFLAFSPESFDTSHISFASARISRKTSNRITEHSACRLVVELDDGDVLSPFLIKQTPSHLLSPENDAPAYAFDVPPIYKSILELSEQLKTLFLQRTQTSPCFCLCAIPLFARGRSIANFGSS